MALPLQLPDHTAPLGRQLLGLRNAQGIAQSQPIDALIEAVAQPGGIATVILLATFAFTSTRNERHTAAAAVARLMTPLAADELMRMERVLRTQASASTSLTAEYAAIQPGEVALASDGPPFPAALFGVASFHSNGYVRAAAVRMLAGFNDGRELPFLLMRANDWVTPVHADAMRALKNRLTPAYVAKFATNIGLMHKLFVWRRHDHHDLLEAIYRLLSPPAHRADLIGAMNAADAKSRALLYDMLARMGGAEMTGILDSALRDPDRTIQLWAARQCAAMYVGGALEDFAAVALRNKFSDVRMHAAYAIAERLPHRIQIHLWPLLMDPAASVRLVAQHYAGKRSGNDCRQYYLAQMLERDADANRLQIAVHGLAEVGTQSDAQLLVPLVDHESPKVAAAAIYGLARLDGDNYIEAFCHALLAGAPAAAKHAEKALSKRAMSLDRDRLWSVFQEQGRGARRLRILRVLLRRSKWEELHHALLVLSDGDPDARAIALASVDGWIARFNRSQIQPTAAQRAELHDLLRRHQGNLPPGRYSQLDYLI